MTHSAGLDCSVSCTAAIYTVTRCCCYCCASQELSTKWTRYTTTTGSWSTRPWTPNEAYLSQVSLRRASAAALDSICSAFPQKLGIASPALMYALTLVHCVPPVVSTCLPTCPPACSHDAHGEAVCLRICMILPFYLLMSLLVLLLALLFSCVYVRARFLSLSLSLSLLRALSRSSLCFGTVPLHGAIDFVERMPSMPLQFQPGSRYNYGINSDVVGRLVEVISGQYPPASVSATSYCTAVC